MINRTANLTEPQHRMIELAGRALPPAWRSGFQADVLRRLAGKPSDMAIQCAINVVLDRLRRADDILEGI